MPDHRAMPGPDYWSYRCLICGEPVGLHRTLLQRLRAWILRGHRG